MRVGSWNSLGAPWCTQGAPLLDTLLSDSHGHNGWWSRAVTPKHILWPPESHGGPYWGPNVNMWTSGVLLSYDLSWSPHISSIVTQAHQRLGFLRRNLQGSPFRYRGTAYQALVRSQLEYCCTIWDPTLKGETKRIERVQRQAAHWAMGEYGMTSVTRLLKELSQLHHQQPTTLSPPKGSH